MQGMPSMEVESMYDQAVKYLVGERVRRDPTRGLQLLREAANRGHPGAAWDLSSCRHLAAASAADADASSSSSSSTTASSHSFYDDGDDGRCVIDWQRAIKAYQAHAVHNHPIALTNLARWYPPELNFITYY
jgi:TPR repeat protein